ncbi:DUF3152 domain-containing protein [Streptomyces sp. NBC_00659]|uniref:DUF3152 domain-containing protein n=1 Tax=Streptomyces sp. NBC_00659 TaxID=2903669 RepID=UPI002E36EA40|nr:DUF3152 domain-containing protein [Streptomyces sp. NBC_00659]
MGRHSRRGRAGKTDAAQTRADEAAPAPAPGLDGVRRTATRPPGSLGPYPPSGGSPQQGAPRFSDGTPAHGFSQVADGTPARGVPRYADGTPAHGVPRFQDGTPAHGVPRFQDGAPVRGVPRSFEGTPAHGTPRLPDGTPAHGMPQVRGGHPEQREQGGGWGESRAGGAPQGASAGPRVPQQRQQAVAGPRQAYVDAFDLGERQSGGAAGRTAGPRTGFDDPADWNAQPIGTGDRPLPEAGEQDEGKARKGWAFTGIAAAAVTTVLAVVVAGQMATGGHDADARAQSADAGGRATQDSASRGDDRPTQSGQPQVAAVPLTYAQQMARTYPLGAKLKASGKFAAVPGVAEAPGKGRKYTYRVDIEQGLDLDGALFADAVQKTLNDKRSWAHGGARTFERIDSGKPDFVITLASPGTTAEWCAKSGLDTTEDNVSCDSASTERVMINAYRWAQGSKTYGFGDEIHAYRQMLINHEVGHRLGYGHVTCEKDGDLAPVMQQQTKFLDHDGIHCLPNAWPYPKS